MRESDSVIERKIRQRKTAIKSKGTSRYSNSKVYDYAERAYISSLQLNNENMILSYSLTKKIKWFIKRVLRKILSMTYGWYFFPKYKKQIIYNENVVFAIEELEREICILNSRISSLEMALKNEDVMRNSDGRKRI